MTDEPMVPCGPCAKDPRWPNVRCTHGHYREPASPAVPLVPQGCKTDEEVVVAMLAACEATIRHLWDIAGFFDMDQCRRIRDEIHILNKITLPAIRDLQARPLPPPPLAEDAQP